MIDDIPLNNALLPAGFCDLLPPEAEVEAQGLQRLMDVFSAYGYERVSPPLLEFEQSLLSHSGAAIAEQTFRLMDPTTHYMMGLRPDITPQIARIASTRLINTPRPLRLSYAGACVWVSGTKSSTTRQITQAGIELIGVDTSQADAEVIAIAAEALTALGIDEFSFDLMMPQMAQAIIRQAQLDEDQNKKLMRALDRKDAAAVGQIGGELASILTTMLHAAGPADRAIEVLRNLSLSEEASQIRERFLTSVEAIQKQNPNLQLTIDPVEFRGWSYHTGLCVSVYVTGLRGEVGYGGRYLSNNNESACGLTLRPDILLQAAKFFKPRARVFVVFGQDINAIKALQEKGYATILALGPIKDIEVEARRLKCRFVFEDGQLRSL